MTDIDVPDWVTEAALTAYVNAWDVSVTGAEKCTTSWDDEQIQHARAGIRAALRAAWAAWVVKAGFTNSEEMRELLAGRGGWVSGIELDGDTHTLYKLRQEKPE